MAIFSNVMKDNGFLYKLHKVVNANLGDENFGVSELATELGLSRSQTLRKVKALVGKSANQFIREIRLEKAVELLNENKFTASEIAYEVGFNSPSYFNKCFHDKYGHTPGEAKFKKLYPIKNTKENTNIKQNGPQTLMNGNKKKDLWGNKKNIFRISLLGIVLIIIYLFYISISEKVIFLADTSQDKSIAVLPFKNLSNDDTNQYFADGVMDDILNHLSSIKELKVISRTTMDQYRVTNKSIPKIAKELNVSYIIESSIQKYGDSIRIITQLIDAKRDRHIWSRDFKREFKNIFALESEIAKQIAKELKATITPIEIQRIEKIPTKNMDAYDLYLKGKYSFNSNNNNDLIKYIGYLNQCLTLDPDFALAYAALARAKIQRMRAQFIPATKENILEAKALAIKSIELNDNARGHSSLGWLLLWFEWDWEEAEKQFKLAIQINPNYEGGHVYLSELLYNIKGDFITARNHVDLALYLAPYSYYIHQVSSYIYFNEGNFNQSIKEAEKCKEINKENPSAYWRNFQNYLNLGNEEMAISELIEGWSYRGDDSKLTIKEEFKKSGVKGVYNLLIKYSLEKSNELKEPYLLANYFALLGDKENSLKWLEVAYKQHNPDIVYLKYNPNFKHIHKEPRFMNILEKMNLGGYK